MREFNIGDRVLAIRLNKAGVIEDKLYSHKLDAWMYTIHFDDSGVAYKIPIKGDALEAIEEKTYRWEVFQADDNVVTAVMYESVGGVEREVDRRHGHIIHSGLIGLAQAASYAMKNIYTGMNGGKYIGSEDDGYVQKV